MWDCDGRRYLDATSGPVVVNVGHGNRRVLEAMSEQASRATYAYPAYLESESNVRFGQRLLDLAGPGFDRALVFSGGSEAVEKCLEFCRSVALARGELGRTKVISRRPSYHGSTLATMALGGNQQNEAFAQMARPGPTVFAPSSYRPRFGLDAVAFAEHCAEELEQTIIDEGAAMVLAFIIEPIMGFSGGADFAPDAYYRRIREICDRHGVLLVYDEVISGAGRSGRFLAAHHWPDSCPDLVVLAKGLGSGYYPLSAVLAPKSLVDLVVDHGGFHLGHTYKASPLGCAVGLAVLDEIVERDLMTCAERSGDHLRKRLRQLQATQPLIGDVRGRGLLNAIEIVADAETRAMLPRRRDVPREISDLASDEGLLIYARRTYGGVYGDWILVTPPLIADSGEIDVLVDRLARTLKRYQEELERAG